MKIDVLPVVIAGGSGTRLWPLSRAGLPKQFLTLAGHESLFQAAALRVLGLSASDIDTQAPVVVSNEEHRFLVLDQLRDIGIAASAVLLEPIGRNTAPALTLAALQAVEGGKDPVLVVVPADHNVPDLAAFVATARAAVRAAAGGGIVLMGIKPNVPETGYGYIRCAAAGKPGAPRSVAQFVEKPNLETAQRYLESGEYFWNGGMFVLRASTWLAALTRFRPDIETATRAAWLARESDGAFVRPGRDAFAVIPADSVDYAVMERCPGTDISLHMVELNAGWNDLGSWDAVYQVLPQDQFGNASVGDVIAHDTQGTLVHASSRLVTTVGLRDLVVVETPDAVLVADRSASQEVKQIVGQLDLAKRGEQTLHRKVHRPWGWYDSIDRGPRFQVKRIMVKPGASLSLQMHHHRAEHWIVVSGTAEVTCGERKTMLTENQSTYIPLGEKHRLANPGKMPLELIEVQSGSYFGEDDIVRFEDTYGRS